MSRRPKYPQPFFMIFPWIRTAGLLFLLTFIVIFIFRLSETGGPESGRACIAAIITSVTAAVCSIYPVGKVWRKEILAVLTAVMIGSAIRLLIGGTGLAIIAFFTQINKIWYIFYVVIYYILFMTVDTAFAIWMFDYCRKDNKERSIHGNLWDMVS